MAFFIDISATGDKALARKLGKLTRRVQKKITRRALRDAAKIVQVEAKLRVPVSIKRRRPGKHLRDTLKVRKPKGARRDDIAIGIETGTREELGILPDDPYYYPAAVELGTSRQSVQSFLRSSLYENEGRVIDIFAARMRFLIQSEAKR